MRRNTHIILQWMLIGFVSLVLTNCASNSSKEESAVSSMTDSVSATASEKTYLEETFETDTLTKEQLMVFQKRAQEKLQDFINYVEIISNKSYHIELRNEASKQTDNLFADSSVSVNISLSKISETNKSPRSISNFMNDVRSCEYDSIKVKTDSVVISLPEKSDTTLKYLGEISARVKIEGYKNGIVVFNSSTIQKAETIIFKTEKQFGSEKKMLWTASIGALK